MKAGSIFFIIFGLSVALSAQVLTSDPPYATENDSIVIYFDATKASSSDLIGYTGDLYVHTGVNSTAGNWQHVIGDWGNNSSQPKLTRLATDYYKLLIGNPRDFYSITNPAEKIFDLDFVFRSADGSKQTEDLFYSLFEPGITAVVVSPKIDKQFGDPQRSPVFLNETDSLQITVTAAALGVQVDSIALQSNLVTLAKTTNDTLTYTFSAQAGNNLMKAIAYGSGATKDTATFFLMVNPTAVNQDLPPGRQDGINYENNTSVTLSLFAPYKDFVYLIGDFNDWKVDQAYLMNKDIIDADSTHFWLTLDNLTPGEEYAFQYLVDGELRIADPYTDKVLDPWNDQYISEQTYPNLKAYPAAKTDFPVSVFQTNQRAFNWENSSYDKPAKEDLLIYELLLRDFLEQHDYATLVDTLDYLQNLGINAIELMPVNEFEGNESWGYNPSFYFALDKYYGPKDSFKQFVDACHTRGIALIMDMVLNHSYGQSPFVRLYNEGDYGKPTPENPWYNVTSPNSTYSWGYDFNHDSKATQKLVDRVTQYWIEDFKVDGFRFDFSKGFTNTRGDGWAYDASRISILKRMADQIWQIDPSSYVILEHFTDNSEEENLCDYGMMLWGNSNYNYNEATMGYNSEGKSDFSWGFYKTRGWLKQGLVTYMESHDEERLMFKNLQYGNNSAGYDVQDFCTALNRMKLAGAFFFTLPGPKMIWQGGELGYEVSIDENGRTSKKPFRWQYLQDANRLKLYKTWAALIKLRQEHEVFRNPLSINISLSGAGKSINLSHSEMNVTIVGNFDVVARAVDPNFPYSGTWYDYFSGDTVYITDATAGLMLEPGEFHIYTSKWLEPPEAGLLSALKPGQEQIPEKFNLAQNYPNPFNPTTVISYQLPVTSDVTLTVYNARGQKVGTLVNEKQNAGYYRLNFEAANLASGIYFYRLVAGNQVQTRKMILVH